jgi:thiamine biosynthesis lipoprotein
MILSDYRDDSELNRACSTAGRRPTVISDDLYQVLEKSLYFSRLTGGAFDITLKPLVELWHRSRDNGRVPESDEVLQKLKLVGYKKVLLNPRTRSLRLEKEGVRLDLGAIAKGYAADEAFDHLQKLGMSSILVDAGGDIRMGNPPPGESSWRIEDSVLDRDREDYFQLSNCSIATSGDRYQFVEINGTKYSHIVDVKTGLGHRGSRQVTVVAPQAVTADALATAFSVLPLEAFDEIAGRLEKVEVRIIQTSGDSSPGIEVLVKATTRFPRTFLP